jgi:hypothetical protein
VVEDNQIGSHGGYDDTVEHRRVNENKGWIMVREANPGSITGVWAPKNTRGAIWDAMKARETFATSGTRIQPRFFGGNLAPAADPVALVERVASRLLHGSSHAALKAEIADAVGRIVIPVLNSAATNQAAIDSAKRNRVNAALLLVLASPEFAVQP